MNIFGFLIAESDKTSILKTSGKFYNLKKLEKNPQNVVTGK